MLLRHDIANIALTVVPTQACNFKCTYCYESSRPNNYMNKEVADKLVKYIASMSDRLDFLQISWYGGEPLLAINQIVSLTKEFEKLNIKSYMASIVTNGYLLNNRNPDF
ncbi:MAG: 4Fe-4S cluster-binding domain-containing protein [Prevotellaceae bacterium]|jgi:uncharacterized protein|nr:4Fe-4S cluster-binding domain-containing protein [Prevotellaceae bacterium]